MRIQTCLPGLKPPLPTIRTPQIARRIAQRIVAEVNPDNFYWEASEIPDRVEDVTQEIIRVGRPATVFSRLHFQQPPYNDKGDRAGHPYGWEGIDEHCRCLDEIAAEELAAAIEQHRRDYGP